MSCIVEKQADGRVREQAFLDGFDVRTLRQISREEADFASALTQFDRLGFEPLRIATRQNQVIAAPGEPISVNRANSRRASRDQGGALVRLIVYDVLPWFVLD